MTDVLGPTISRWLLEVATLQTIAQWLETYLSDCERNILGVSTAQIPRPPAPALQLPQEDGTVSSVGTSIFGALDLIIPEIENFYNLMPMVIVDVQPVSAPRYFLSGDYSQSFHLNLAAIYQGQDPTLARLYADMYGTALMKLIVQVGDNETLSALGEYVTRLQLTTYPTTSYAETNRDDLLIVQSMVGFTLDVDQVVNDQSSIPAPVPGDSLPVPDPSQTPTPDSTVETVNIAVAAVADGSDF